MRLFKEQALSNLMPVSLSSPTDGSVRRGGGNTASAGAGEGRASPSREPAAFRLVPHPAPRYMEVLQKGRRYGVWAC